MTSRSPFSGYGPGPDPPKPEIDIDIDIENDLNIPDLENPNEDIDLGDGQVSCDWWIAGHVTTVLTSDWFRWSTDPRTSCAFARTPPGKDPTRPPTPQTVNGELDDRKNISSMH